MKTTHQIAKELLGLPDVRLCVEMWCLQDYEEIIAKMAEYENEDGTQDAFITWQRKQPPSL